MKGLFKYFIERPLVVNLMMAMVLLLGLEHLRAGPIQFSPFMEFGIYSVSTVRPGVSPEKMELSVTVPLEEELLEVEGVKQVISNSVAGLSLIQVSAEASADSQELARVYADLQKAIDRAAARLPSDLLEKPQLHSMTSDDSPLLSVLVSGHVDEALLRQTSKKLQHMSREVAGVSAVELTSYRDREVRLLLDPLKLNQLGVSFSEIEQAIAGRNISDTGGSFDSFVGEQDVVALGEFEDPKEVGEVIVRASGYGDFLRVKDLAQVVMDYEAPRVEHYIDGRPAIMLDIRIGSQSNEIKITKALQAQLQAFRQDLPDGVQVDVVYERERMTTSVIEVLLDNALLGALLIALALIAFFPWRATLWVIAGIPVAVMIAFLCFPAYGMTLTSTSMVAMVMMLGLLVDDAIVISENIYRHYEQGQSAEQSALQGTLEVAKPVLTGALTTVLAFSPMLFMGGMEAKLMWVIPATVSLVVLASLLECYFLLPAHIAHALKKSGPLKPKALWFGRVESRYRRFLLAVTAQPKRCMLLLCVSLVGAIMMVGNFIKFDSYPVKDSERIIVIAELPSGSPLQDTAAAMQRVERYIRTKINMSEVKSLYVIAGHHDSDRIDLAIEGQQSNWGKLRIELLPTAERTVSAPELVAQIKPGLEAMTEFQRISARVVVDAPPTGFPVELQVIGADDERGQVADELLAFLNAEPHVTEAWSNYAAGKSVINLQLDYAKMAAYGLSVASVTKAIKVAFDGYIFDELQTIDERIRYRLQLQPQHLQNVESFRSLLILNQRGEAIPLRNIASFEVKPGQQSILHYAGSRTETVFADINRELSSVTEINQRLQAFIAAQNFGQRYPSARIKLQGEYIAQQQTAEQMGGSLLLILISIFVLMVLLFNSLLQPLLVMLVIPFSFVAVMVALILHNFTLSVPAVVGFLGLTGILINSALVMIDRVNRLHQQELERGELSEGSPIGRASIVEGSVHRLRPIIITAVSSAAGLGPAAYGVAGTHATLTPMIMVMFWGVVVGAMISLLTLPIFMAFFSDLQSIKKKRLFERTVFGFFPKSN